jgi:hypothetical protein
MRVEGALVLLLVGSQTTAFEILVTYGTHDDAPIVPLITGCGRSGTHTAGELLQSLGISAIHEGASETSVAVSW